MIKMDTSIDRTDKDEKVNKQNIPEIRFPEFDGEWNETKLGQISRIHDGTHGTHQNVEKGKYLLSAENIENGKVIIKEEPRIISEEDFNKIHKKYFIENGDLLLTIVGSIGRTAIVENYNKEYTFQRSVAIINSEINSYFLNYYIQSPKVQKELKIRTNSSAQGGIYLKELSKIKINCPSDNEQQKIARLFLALDQKIEFMEKKYTYLLKLKTYYQEVMFNNLDETKQFKLEDIIKKFSTGLNPRKNFKLNTGGTNYYVTIKNFHNGSLYLDDTCDKIDDQAIEIINKRSNLERGDVLFSSIGRIGDSYLVKEKPINWNINESVFALKANLNRITPEYLYCLLNSDRMQYSFKRNITGSTLESIKMKDLKKIKVHIHININNQKHISSLIIGLENKIKSYQKIIELNKEFKRSLLSKMFC